MLGSLHRHHEIPLYGRDLEPPARVRWAEAPKTAILVGQSRRRRRERVRASLRERLRNLVEREGAMVATCVNTTRPTLNLVE